MIGGILLVVVGVWSTPKHPIAGSSVTDVAVPAALAGERLDRVVAMVTGVSRAVAARTGRRRRGRARRSRRTVRRRPRRRGRRADRRASPSPSRIGVGAIRPSSSTSCTRTTTSLVVDKPAGLVVHPGAGNTTGTLVHGLLARFPEIADVGDPARPGIVHRLDKGTSGLLVVARSPAAYDVARRRSSRPARSSGATSRSVWGDPSPPTGVIDAPVGRSSPRPARA